MSNGLLYIAGLFSLALAALFAVPHFVDWNGYRGVFEEEATRILGREVRVGGDVNVRLLPAPYVSFEKLRIADPTGTTGEPFFRGDSFTMRLSVAPLLKGIIEANEIVLEKPVLRLAVDAEGGGNWRSFSIAPGSLPFVPAGVTLQSVKIVDGVVAFHGPKGIGFAELDGLNGELKVEFDRRSVCIQGHDQVAGWRPRGAHLHWCHRSRRRHPLQGHRARHIRRRQRLFGRRPPRRFERSPASRRRDHRQAGARAGRAADRHRPRGNARQHRQGRSPAHRLQGEALPATPRGCASTISRSPSSASASRSSSAARQPPHGQRR